MQHEPIVVLATHNAHKVVELRRLLSAADIGVQVVGLDACVAYPEPAETAASFAGNALIKARACRDATGHAALADDSGLAVDILNGMPGVRSARWAGPGSSDADNNALLLRQLADVEPERRGAQFVCAMALVLPEGPEVVRHGDIRGHLVDSPRGRLGFGYDPLFVPEGETVTTAELAPEHKDAISHRGRAVRAILPALREALASGSSGPGSSGPASGA